MVLVALVAIGLGLIFPQFEALLEKPFSRLPQKQFGSGKNGFGLGLALGVLYVPCAGPVLAAIASKHRASPASEPETQAAMRLIRRIHPAVTVWYRQHQDLVDMAGGDRGVARRYAQLAHLRATAS